MDGHDFFLDGLSVPGGSTFGTGGQPSRMVALTCTLANGDLMSNSIRIYDGGALMLVPEPATLSLLGAGTLALLRRRKE